MKKIVCLLLSLLIVAVGALAVSAAAPFGVDIAGDEVVTAGSTVSYEVTVNRIGLEVGLIGGDFTVTYDTDFFTFDSISSKSIEGWNMDSRTNEAGIVELHPAFAFDDDDAAGHAVKTDGTISYTIKFKVLSQSEKTETTISVSSGEGNDVNLNPVEGADLGSLKVSLKQKLATPTGLVWNEGVASWDAVENASGYSVQAYQNGTAVGDAAASSETSYDFTGVLTAGGKYTFTVTAVSDSLAFESSAESAQSSGFYTVVGTLTAPRLRLESDVNNGGLTYAITDTNPAGTVSQYVIQLFESGSSEVAAELHVDRLTGSIPCENGVEAGKKYAATVLAVTSDADDNTSSAPSDKTAAATAAERVTKLQIVTSPKLDYTEGQALDLSAFTVAVTYQSGRTENVSFADFASHNLTVSIANGTVLSQSDSGKAVTVSFGNTASATTANLTVTDNACRHNGAKHTDRKDPTCGEAGYENTICDICGTVLSSTVLNATGEHEFGEWETIFEPTATMRGVRRRVCAVCGVVENDTIPMLDVQTDTSPVSTGPETTPAVTEPASPSTGTGAVTTPSETEPPQTRDLDDLSRVFLIVVIVIFAIIMLLMIGWVVINHRNAKLRAQRAASNRNRRPTNRR